MGLAHGHVDEGGMAGVKSPLEQDLYAAMPKMVTIGGIRSTPIAVICPYSRERGIVMAEAVLDNDLLVCRQQHDESQRDEDGEGACNEVREAR
jgi:hypothetical protein